MAWRIVLVRPRNPLNIGAAARAMANFGFRDLVVVEPYEEAWREARSAVGAEAVLRAARAVNDLGGALAGTALAVGTTSGARRNLGRDMIPLAAFPEWLEHSDPVARAALLFGSEKTGLSNEHLSYCHALVRITTSAPCPSMNLGQAVAVCCYELARAGAMPGRLPGPDTHHSQTANSESLEHVLERATRVLDCTGYFKPKARTSQLLKMRRLLLDLGLTNKDVRVLGGILAQIEWKFDQS